MLESEGTKIDSPEVILARYNKIRKDPWEFLRLCAFTLDQADEKNPIKSFPCDKDYLYLYTRIWQKYPRIAVPKSRRMVMSWVNVALYLWDTLFHVGRFNGFVSKKEDNSDELVKRAEFIYDHIPEHIIPREMLPKKVSKYCLLGFPEINSQIQGFPQGADQLRQFTLSGLLADEMAFWDKARESYSASVPTLEGGGRFTGISSRAPGFFKLLVFDQLDINATSKKLVEEEINIPSRFPMEGVECWINPNNKFLIFELHYTADPKKRDPKYRDKIRADMPFAQYMQEYEKNWDSYSGLPVYQDYVEKIHGSKTRLKPELGLPLLRGWDFGLTPACVVAQVQDSRLVVLWEKTAQNMGITRFAELVMNDLRMLFPGWPDQKRDWLDFADPSGAFRNDDDEGTCFKVLSSKPFGLNVKPGAISWEARKGSVEHFLTGMTKDGPNFLLDLDMCPVLGRGFAGGYRYPEKSAEVEPTKIRPIKDEHSHPHDALQMITTGFAGKIKKPSPNIPSPAYTFTKRSGVTDNLPESLRQLKGYLR